MDKLFGKKKTIDQQVKEQDREMRRVNRGLERDRGQLQKGNEIIRLELIITIGLFMFAEEKKLEMEIKKAAKMGNKEACGILAKQLVQLRKQKTRSYAAGAKMSGISG